MNPILRVHLLPDLIDHRDLAGHSAVVIDVLRAGTTIVHALAAGAAEIVPCLEVSEARELAAQRPNVLLGGEREGKRIKGFDLGNSPAEYTAERVAGRTIIFTTTNGTRALHRCLGASRVLIGAFVNLNAVCRVLRDESRVDLVCSGTGGEVSRDDALVAGAIAECLMAEPSSQIYDLNDQARLCSEAWRAVSSREPGPGAIAAALKDTQGGRNLIAIGQDGDLQAAADVDRFDIVPELDRPNWRIRLP